LLLVLRQTKAQKVDAALSAASTFWALVATAIKTKKSVAHAARELQIFWF